MSHFAINKYLNDLADLKKVSGSHRETIVREAFKDLLKTCAKSRDLVFLAEYSLPRQDGRPRTVDGALVYDLRLPFGYWEAKDEEDDLDKEIAKKFKRGYPRDNIIFEDSAEAVLIQNGNEVTRCAVADIEKLSHLLGLFFGYERPEIGQFRKAVEQFKTDLPAVLEALRAMIEKAQGENAAFRKAAAKFLKHAQETINPAVTADDIREMLIQHILTEEIFSKVFDEDGFHRENNVAKELNGLESLFFTGALKKNTLKGLEPYYNAIRATAHQISTHSEKQTFLKVVYEGFYRVYNKKAADRLGVVYTPQDIVRFMVESADWLCEKHFGKSLIDQGVEILDPATGTGTFICELLEHFRGQPRKLAHKYKEELHANEVAILPYYVANLNIEATYAAITGQYAEFPNLCFVDTLDNVAGLGIRSGHQHDLFGSLSDENVARIKRQNARKISVIIGNPPYNANQQNENDNNKNRAYPRIDERIKATYIQQSSAQKTKAYDMYTRFFRWASDRLHDDGILAFISNRSFIDSRTMDGFRSAVAREYTDVYVVDLGGDVRANPKLSGTKNNVFGIQTGVAISFLVKRREKKGAPHQCAIHYARRPEMETAADKLEWLGQTQLSQLSLEWIKPDAKSNWINQTENDFESLIPIASKATKTAKTKVHEKAIFKLFSLGVVTNRDDWVFSETDVDLERKVHFLIDAYNLDRKKQQSLRKAQKQPAELDTAIKWTRAVKRDLKNNVAYKFDEDAIAYCEYRPFVRRRLYFSRQLNEMLYQIPCMFGSDAGDNVGICYVAEDRALFSVLALREIPNKDFFMPSAGQVLTRFTYPKVGERIDNITDWALGEFRKRYGNAPARRGAEEPPHPAAARPPSPQRFARDAQNRDAGEGARRAGEGEPLTKDAIFHYVYAVLHDPAYRETYAQNLKREFPRIPFHDDFWLWAD